MVGKAARVFCCGIAASFNAIPRSTEAPPESVKRPMRF